MILTFGIVKNYRGFQGECLEVPEIIACGWDWPQLIDSITEHTLAFLPELNLKKLKQTPQSSVYCGWVKIHVNQKSNRIKILSQKLCI